MNDKFLKTRVPPGLYQSLLARAGSEGKRLGTLVREILESDTHALSTSDALARIETALAQSRSDHVVQQPVMDPQVPAEVRHILLLVIELAMQSNAQIVPRVAEKLALQSRAKQ